MTATLEPNMTSPVAFEPPGPGAWTLDFDHQASARGLLMQELFTRRFVAGTQSCFSRYGMPLDRLEGRHVNGWFYVHPVPAGVPDNGKNPPPAPILKIATRLLPELRRRRRIAAETIATRRWLVDARAWAAERLDWLARCDTLLMVDLDLLDDAALADHLQEALTLAGDMIERHFSLLGPTVGVGRLLVAGRALGLAPDQIIPVLRGSSPASTESRRPLAELAELVLGQPEPQSVEALRSLSPGAAELVDSYLRRFGWLPLADDVEATTLAEHPDRLVELVRSQRGGAVEQSSTEQLDSLLARLPAEDRARIDQLVAEARECYASLDDNSGITALTIGVVRRAVLEAARRGEQRSAIEVPDDVFNLTPSELVALAAGGESVGRDEVASRRARRADIARHTPPSVLGGPVVAPPDPGVFPGPVAELAAAIGAYLDLKFTASPDRSVSEPSGSLQVRGEAPVVGAPVVTGTATGRIVVARDASDAVARIEPGDILVCPYTSAAHNAIFPLLAGVLTQFGGPLGHTAVLAREFGIPAVVGARSLPLHLDGLHGTLTAPPAN